MKFKNFFLHFIDFYAEKYYNVKVKFYIKSEVINYGV